MYLIFSKSQFLKVPLSAANLAGVILQHIAHSTIIIKVGIIQGRIDGLGTSPFSLSIQRKATPPAYSGKFKYQWLDRMEEKCKSWR